MTNEKLPRSANQITRFKWCEKGCHGSAAPLRWIYELTTNTYSFTYKLSSNDNYDEQMI